MTDFEIISDEPKQEEKSLEERISDIIKEYGQISNIPMNHDYWELLKELRLKNNP